MLPGTSHKGVTTIRTLFTLAPLTGNEEGSKGLVVLRVRPTPARFPINSLYIPMDNTPLHSISSVCHPWGKVLLSTGVLRVLVGDRLYISLMIPSLFQYRLRPHGSEPHVARIEQNSWLGRKQINIVLCNQLGRSS